MNRLLKALGQRIRELRKKQGYSQESFADRCGVHRTFMGAIERGETNLSFQNLCKVAEALGVTLSHLLSGVERSAAKMQEAGRKKTSAKTAVPSRAAGPRAVGKQAAPEASIKRLLQNAH